MNQILVALRNGTFLTRARLRLWSAAFMAGFAIAIAFLFATAHGLSDYAGRPLGTDFSDVYAAGVAVLHGQPAAPFDIINQQTEEEAIFGPATPLYGWCYPPIFLLVAAPLAKLPYVAALVVWQLTTLAIYLLAIRVLLMRAPELTRDRSWLLAALGFTAVYVNLTHGHNGFLTAALFAGALATLDERPVLAGILFGLLSYKPQFAIVIPLALAASGRWRSFAAAAASVCALVGLTIWLFGAETWTAFLANLRFTREVVLEQGATGFYKMQSVFAWVRLWHGPIWLAYAAQLAVLVLVATALVRLWRSTLSFEIKGAALCLAAVLATPYSMDYDLMLLAPAIALLAVEVLRHGARPYEIAGLALLWLAPIMTRGIAQHALIPLGLWSVMLAFGALARRLSPRGQSRLARQGRAAIVRPLP